MCVECVYVVFVVRSVPPHFSIPPESVEVLPGGAANLTCVAVGSPTPVVTWHLGSVQLDNSDVIISVFTALTSVPVHVQHINYYHRI